MRRKKTIYHNPPCLSIGDKQVRFQIAPKLSEACVCKSTSRRWI